MLNNTKMGAVGERSAVLAFKALGMQVIPTSTEEETTNALFKLKKQGVSIVFITENEAKQAEEALSRYRNDFELSVIPIPGSNGSEGYAMEIIKNNVEKALGANILFED